MSMVKCDLCGADVSTPSGLHKCGHLSGGKQCIAMQRENEKKIHLDPAEVARDYQRDHEDNWRGD